VTLLWPSVKKLSRPPAGTKLFYGSRAYQSSILFVNLAVGLAGDFYYFADYVIIFRGVVKPFVVLRECQNSQGPLEENRPALGLRRKFAFKCLLLATRITALAVLIEKWFARRAGLAVWQKTKCFAVDENNFIFFHIVIVCGFAGARAEMSAPLTLCSWLLYNSLYAKRPAAFRLPNLPCANCMQNGAFACLNKNVNLLSEISLFSPSTSTFEKEVIFCSLILFFYFKNATKNTTLQI